MGFLTRKKSALKNILSGSLGEPLEMIPSNPAERPFVSGVCITIWTGWFCALTITWHVFVMVMPLWGDLFL